MSGSSLPSLPAGYKFETPPLPTPGRDVNTNPWLSGHDHARIFWMPHSFGVKLSLSSEEQHSLKSFISDETQCPGTKPDFTVAGTHTFTSPEGWELYLPGSGTCRTCLINFKSLSPEQCIEVVNTLWSHMGHRAPEKISFLTLPCLIPAENG